MWYKSATQEKVLDILLLGTQHTFFKDHLGNTRMVLTDETPSDMYPAATMEVGDSATENLYYMNLDSTRSALPPGYPTDTTTNPNNYVAKVSSDGTVPAIGPAVVLKVMAGDQFSIRVSSWYRLNGTTPGTPVNPLTDLLTSLISGISGIPNPEGPGLCAVSIRLRSVLMSCSSCKIPAPPSSIRNRMPLSIGSCWIINLTMWRPAADFPRLGAISSYRKPC